ncbi:MAG: GNAT family N-acetyltransferase [Alphaproteobacteria bacterium]|nr:GNAT family N-acetyltransferase [Alphaproteobacteria bacterium]
MVGAVPVVETERLRLRGHRLDDFEACAALWADPVVTRFIGGKASTRDESWMRLLRNVGHWSLLGFGYWLVEEKASDRFVGEIGFSELKREIEPGFEGVPEAGWVLLPTAHGRGIATEAVKAVLAWGDKKFTGGPTVCIINPENSASIGVAAKCGYREVARTTYKGAPIIQYRRN